MPETIPATFPYLDVNLLRRRRNVAAVTLPGAASGRKVGVIWSPQADADDNRHLACRFDTFKPLFSTPGACFFNLHAGTTSQTAASLSALNVESPGASISNPADLALLIDQLGLIVGIEYSDHSHCRRTRQAGVGSAWRYSRLLWPAASGSDALVSGHARIPATGTRLLGGCCRARRRDTCGFLHPVRYEGGRSRSLRNVRAECCRCHHSRSAARASRRQRGAGHLKHRELDCRLLSHRPVVIPRA